MNSCELFFSYVFILLKKWKVFAAVYCSSLFIIGKKLIEGFAVVLVGCSIVPVVDSDYLYEQVLLFYSFEKKYYNYGLKKHFYWKFF